MGNGDRFDVVLDFSSECSWPCFACGGIQADAAGSRLPAASRQPPRICSAALARAFGRIVLLGSEAPCTACTPTEPEFRGKSIYLRNAGPESFYLSPQDEGEEFPPETTAQVRGGRLGPAAAS